MFSKLAVLLGVAIFLPASLIAGTAQGVGQGGLIPADPTATAGVTVSNAVITGSGLVAPGNAITVTLLGLQHDYSGDLIITLSYIDAHGNTVQSVDLLNRIGQGNTAADFGNNQGSGDNYVFNSGFTASIWSVAACADPPACTTPLGDADSIPGVSTDTVNNGQYFPSTTGGAKTNLSSAFAGLDVAAGTWRLTITDAAQLNVGSFVGWQISIATVTAPQPANITAAGGTPQSATVSTPFASGLQAIVTDSSGNPISNVNVTFTAPASGASATFNGSVSATAATNASGIATSPIPVANASSGAYSVVAAVSGLTATASFNLTNTAAVVTNSAAFQRADSTTLGNWKDVYGGDGSIIPNDSTHSPGYATLNFSNALLYSWSPSTTDPRALLKYSSASDRIASTYYNLPGFTIDVNLTDGNTHQLALYLEDWDHGNRSETISIYDATSKQLLDTRTASNFATTPEYLIWKVSGHVSIQVTLLTGYNAVLSGIFFDSVSTTPPPTVSITAPTAGAVITGVTTLTAQAQSSIGIQSVQFVVDGQNTGSPVTGSGPSYSISWDSTTVGNGAHTVSAVAVDTKSQSSGSNSVAFTVSNSGNTASAVFQRADSTTLGNWKGVYGGDGSIIPNDSSYPPSYATVNFSNALLYTWSPSTTDPRALLKYSSASDRIASLYYDVPGFTIDVRVTDGNTHQLALYLEDWDNGNRSETISIYDATSNQLLDTRTAANFASTPEYLIWKISGHVSIQVTLQGGINAVLSGIFFDSLSTTPPPTVSITAPTAGAVISGVTTLAAQAQSSVGIQSVQFVVDGQNTGAPVTGSGPSYSISWDSTTVGNGAHTVAAVATDTKSHSSTAATVGFTVSNSGNSAAAAFQRADNTTLGNWKGVYGGDGSIIPNDSTHTPGYAVVNFNNALLYTWSASTTDPRSLLKYSSTTDRIASLYYNVPGFTIDVNLTDGNTHQLALYLEDWDSGNRSETISIYNAASNQLLDTRTASNFATTPEYLIWTVSGHISIQVTLQGGINAALSGIFFDSISTTPPPTVSITAPTAGAVVSGVSTLSAQAQSGVGIQSVQFVVDGQNTGSPVTGSGPGYSISWDSTTVGNGSHTVAAVATDTQSHSTGSASVSFTVSNSGNTASAVFKRTDSTTLGNWKGVYGGDGSIIPNDSTHSPGYATLNFSNALLYSWSPSTTDPRALLKYSSASDRIASTYYNVPSFSIDVKVTDGNTHQLALYLEDWDHGNRSETISIYDATSNQLLDTRTASNFATTPEYLIWTVSGHVSIQVTLQGGTNAVLSGLFFDSVSTTPPPTVSVTAPTAGAVISGATTLTAQAQSSVGIQSVQFVVDGQNTGSPVTGSGPNYSISWDSTTVGNGAHTVSAVAVDTKSQSAGSAAVSFTVSNSGNTASAVFKRADSATLGNWKGVYGADGSIVPNDSTYPPGYATVTFSNALQYSWAPSTTDPRALLKYSSTSDRIASTYYNVPGFTIDVRVTDGNTHQLALYFEDWDYGNRSETISIYDAVSNQLLDSRTAANFASTPEYLIWNVSGHVSVQVTLQGGINAVLSGVFFDPAH